MFVVRGLVTVLILIALAPMAAAQTDAGALRVFVVDSSEGVVPGATILVTNTATGLAQTVVSDAGGYGADGHLEHPRRHVIALPHRRAAHAGGAGPAVTARRP